MYQRALSHFNSKEKKGKRMLNDLYDVNFQLTGSELVALLIESEEIKKHRPEYNRTIWQISLHIALIGVKMKQVLSVLK